MPKSDVAVLTLRLDPRLLKRVDALNARRTDVMKGFGVFSPDNPPVLSRTQLLRWALTEGLDIIEAKLKRKGRP